MNRTLVGVFRSPGDLVAAVRAARAAGWTVEDAQTPYPVHGLPEAMDLAPSRLPVVCFLFGLAGASVALWFQFWTTAIDWPINVGGKPWNSLPAFVPVAFETMVLAAGLGVVGTFLLVARLLPGAPSRLAHPRATDDRFVVVLAPAGAVHDLEAARRLLEPLGAEAVEERIER